jgi:hypothetical protein
LDGTLVLGVGGQAANSDQEIVIDENFGSNDALLKQIPADQTAGAKLIKLLAAQDDKNTLSTIQSVKISQASLSVFDDANAANWFAPLADLTFRKTTAGFEILARADVNSSAEPWHTEIAANYTRATNRFAVSTTIDNFVLANVADKVFALSQFAKVKFPLSGHIDLDVSETGTVQSANADLAVGAGQMNLPDYLAKPIVVDEGNLRVNYTLETGSFNIANSTVTVGGQRADVSGEIVPERTNEGKLTSVKINLKAKNVNLNAAENISHGVLVDRIEFVGKAAVDQARLDIDDLVVMSGNSGVRLRGLVTGGEQSPGIQFAGRLRDLSADMMKKLWPPIIEPGHAVGLQTTW